MTDQKIFLAAFTLSERRYGHTSADQKPMLRLVWALDADDAERKLIAAYPSEPYAIDREVVIDYIEEAIT